VLEVAPDLLGKYLVRQVGSKKFALPILEVEAYDGEKDLACHAAKGRTKRTEILYAKAATIYVYLCYGMYWMLNIVTGPKDYPAAVLIRAAGEFDGPGKLTRALAIDKTLHGKSLGRASGLWIEERGSVGPGQKILQTVRIGVSYAGPLWSKKKYRFLLVKKEKGA